MQNGSVFFLPLFIPAVLTLILPVLVLFQKRSLATIVFLFLCLSIILWTVGLAMFGLLPLEAAYFWNKVFILAACFIAATFLHFIYAYGGEVVNKKGLFVIYAPCVVWFAVICFYPDKLIKDIVLRSWGKESILGEYYIYFGAYYVAFTVFGFWKLLQKVRVLTGVEKQRYELIFTATFLGSSFGGYFNLLLILLGNYRYVWAGPYCSFIIVSVITYAIVKYRLMDVRVAVSSAGIFLVIYSLTLGLPFFLYQKGQYFWAIISLGALATSAPSIFFFLNKRATDKILREAKYCRELLGKAVHGLTSFRKVSQITSFVVKTFPEIMGLDGAAFYTYDGSFYALRAQNGILGYSSEIAHVHTIEYLRQSGPFFADELRHNVKYYNSLGDSVATQFLKGQPADVVLPLVLESQLLGIVFLGKKMNGVNYSDDDLSFFVMVSDQIAMALNNAIGYENDQKTVEQRNHEQRLKDLGVFAAKVAHQMGNRLNRITGALSIFVDYFTDDFLENAPREELVAMNRRFIQKSEMLIRDAESVAQISAAIKRSSKAGTIPTAVRLKELIDGGRLLAEIKHPDFKYNFVENFDPNTLVWANDTIVQDIFSNAIDNSLDAIKTKQGWPKDLPGFIGQITVSAAQKDKMVVIELLDNGVGIKPEDEQHIFVPMWTTKGSDKGTGLGLSAMFNMVQSQGGSIKVSSGYTMWTKLTIELPSVDKNGKVVPEH
jgi:signal transduction histidine kinase